MRLNIFYIKGTIGLIFGLFFTAENLLSQSFPYTIELESFTIAGLNGVHSFAAAKSGGKWLIISGRVDGMHRGGGNGANVPFPTSNKNTTIYVVDPAIPQVWSTSLSSLSTALQDQMSSTNTSFYQDGTDLYVVGGYGTNSAGNHVTHSYITAIDVPSIMTNIMNGSAITGDFIQLSDSRMTIAGGQLGKIGNTFYLVGGMALQESYNRNSSAPTYSSEIRKFEIINNGTTLTISNYTTLSNTEFHRRDYNLIPQIFPDGAYGYMVSSGVFTPSDGVYYNPIEVKSSGYTVIPEATFKQEFSHYQSAKLAMYSTTDNVMHSIFFGGIAQYYYDGTGTKINDTNIPFVKTISRVTRAANGAYSESVFSTEMPVYLGAGSELFLNETLAMSDHGIIDMDQLSGSPITVGYIFGGLQSDAANIFPMNSANSSASNTIYRVKLVSTALPIELANFQGKLNQNISCSSANIELNWQTLSESNTKCFDVERGKYGNFERIGIVNAIGESTQPQDYYFNDKNPPQGRVYYRLKMIDQDGTFEYSEIINITACKDRPLELMPNPTNGNVFITGFSEHFNITILDASGKQYPVKTQAINAGLLLDMNAFPPGVYFIKTNEGGELQTYRVVKN